MKGNPQLETQRKARLAKPRAGYPFRVAHVDGRITNHRSFAAAERSWEFGDIVYYWDRVTPPHNGRWAIWTSAGFV